MPSDPKSYACVRGPEQKGLEQVQAVVQAVLLLGPRNLAGSVVVSSADIGAVLEPGTGLEEPDSSLVKDRGREMGSYHQFCPFC